MGRKVINKPKTEEPCRDALLSDLQILLEPHEVDAQPEGHHAEDARSDIIAVHGVHAVVVEVKKTDSKGSLECDDGSVDRQIRARPEVRRLRALLGPLVRCRSIEEFAPSRAGWSNFPPPLWSSFGPPLTLGAARVASGETHMTFPKTRTLVPGTRRTGLTWSLTAGLGMSWGERSTLDLAWRYTDAGVIETGAGPGRVEWLDGSRDPVGLDLAPTQAPLRSHGLHLPRWTPQNRPSIDTSKPATTHVASEAD